jgi:S-adenosylmethionine hydrolase
LANGVPLLELGTSLTDPVLLELPKPEQTMDGWRGEVIHVDHFGNISSNIRTEHLGAALDKKEGIIVRLNGNEINGMVNTFGERRAGELIALMGSTGNLGVSVVNGNAAVKMSAKIGDEIIVMIR